MSYQNWQVLVLPLGASSVEVKTEIEVVDAIYDRGLGIRMHEDGYPWVVSWSSSCPICAEKKMCNCAERIGRWEQPLHLFVWRFSGRDIPEGHVIHHVDHDKKNARIKNLGIGTPSQHARVHNRQRRKFKPRKRFNAGGLYRPHMPGTVKTPETSPELRELVGTTRPVDPGVLKPKTLRQEVLLLESQLEEIAGHVFEVTADFDKDGRPIPRGASSAEWRQGKTRKLGLKMPRLECTLAEAVFVRFYVYADFDLKRMVDVLLDRSAFPEERERAEKLLGTFLKRPSVSVWVERWASFRRLPRIQGAKKSSHT